MLCHNASMKTQRHPAKKEISLTGVLYALSDPVRLSIVRSLARRGEQTCCAFDVPVAKSTLSHHFKVLRETGVIAQRPEGTAYINQLRREDLDALFPGLLDAVLKAPRR